MNHKFLLESVIKELPGGSEDLLEHFQPQGITTTMAFSQWKSRGVPIKHVRRLCRLSKNVTPADFYPEIFAGLVESHPVQ